MHHWNFKSVVMACQTCNGHGAVHANRRATINDPYPETPCECGLGEHEPCCEVCGFTQEVAGYDCIACEAIDSLTDRDLGKLDVDALAAAMKVAIAARKRGGRIAA